jgi:hypothetical protein
MRGIRDILNTGIILNDSILIGADTNLASIMTRIFIIGTSAARGEVGIKNPKEFVPLEPPVLEFVLPVLLLLEFVPPVLLVLAFMPMEQPVLKFASLG